MAYRRLFFLVEGDDDERLVQEVLTPHFSSRYDYVQSWKYAPETPKKTRQFIHSIRAMGADYVFLLDFDQGPCITSKKEAVQNKYSDRIDTENIQIVVREIEGWYAAGLDSEGAAELGIDTWSATDDLTKEQFDSMIPQRFGSRIVFLREVLKRFDVATAQRKNRSFAYFWRRYLGS